METNRCEGVAESSEAQPLTALPFEELIMTLTLAQVLEIARSFG